ncbi:hypothetical protein NDU88_008017 [Pleurodeles waltl]|uniref:Reverse transcriptase n=1 Tax=Pleurodeles waltl TaxID=8319 RepID=A0AAV7RR47_PLEWA|nr:hypothetical protein NDU88_008017 [Pleurodeles waltl]
MLFNLQKLQAKTKVEEDSVRNFLIADDWALNAATEAQTQQSMNRFYPGCRNFGLTISTKKTEVLHQPIPQKMYAEGEILKAVDKFTYLSSTHSRSVNIDDEGLSYGELAKGKRTQCGQKKHFKDTLKVYLKSFGIVPVFWETLAQDCPAQRSCISKDATSYEQNRTAEAQKKRELCKSIANSLPTNPADHCARCAAELSEPTSN